MPTALKCQVDPFLLTIPFWKVSIYNNDPTKRPYYVWGGEWHLGVDWWAFLDSNWFKTNLLSAQTLLVGGWTNPLEKKYARQNGFILPNFRGEHKTYVKPPTRFPRDKNTSPVFSPVSTWSPPALATFPKALIASSRISTSWSKMGKHKIQGFNGISREIPKDLGPLYGNWLVVSTPSKKKIVKMGSSPGRGENKKYLKPPPRYISFPYYSNIFRDS